MLRPVAVAVEKTKPRYLTIEDIIPKDFLRSPKVVLGEFGNGMGKTYTASQYAVALQKIGFFDRIYIVEYSQRGCENVAKKIRDFGGWAIHHIGVEKFCPMQSRITFLRRLGLSPTVFCSLCPYFQNRYRLAYKIFEEEITQRREPILKPKLHPIGVNDRVCTHPIYRAFVFDPTFEYDYRLQLGETPIIIVPSQVFFTHSIIGLWHRFAKKQRRERKTLLVLDEADTAFFNALKTEIEEISFTKTDEELLKRFSPKSRKLEKIIELYISIYSKIREVHRRRNIVTDNDVTYIKNELKRADPLIRSFRRRSKEILRYVLENRMYTHVFKAARILEEFTHVENVKYALKTVEKTDKGFIMQDYDYGVRLLFDVSYPWKYFWKIVLSATFPSMKIMESRFVSPMSKTLLGKVRRVTRSYENVYIATYQVFESASGRVDRNKELQYAVRKVLEGIKLAFNAYVERFDFQPNGILLIFGNKKQVRKFVDILAKQGVRIYRRGSMWRTRYRGRPFVITYCGSTVARGLDFPMYDISILIAPLLRPPREAGFLDVIDFSKAVNEGIQAVMRIVRSPSPKRPKLIVLEDILVSWWYSQFYPKWFLNLIENNRIDILPKS